jgi:hypothetical protein
VEVASHVVSTACSYCASKLVDVERASPEVDLVAPFRISARAAATRLTDHLARRWWAPGALRRAAKAGRIHPEQLRGVLVPFYAYDATCRSRYRADVGIHWQRTTKGGKDETGQRTKKVVQETEWFPLEGTAVAQLRSHLVPATAGLSEGETRRLVPFDLGRTVRFDPRLLAGWEAELPTRPRHEVDGDAKTQLRRAEARRILDDVLPGNTSRRSHVDTDVTVDAVRLVLLPVWVIAYRFAGKTHRTLIHGQTARCVGGVPVSGWKVAAVAAAVAAVVLAVLWKSGVLPWLS